MIKLTPETLTEKAWVDEHVTTLASGNHTDTKLECDAIFEDPELLDYGASLLAPLIEAYFEEAQVLMTVGDGANVLKNPVRMALNKILRNRLECKESRKRRTENHPHGFYIPGGAVHLAGKDIVFCDDVFTYGTTLRKLARFVTAKPFNGRVIGAVTLFSRDGEQVHELAIPGKECTFKVYSAIPLKIDDWPPEDCTNPVCIAA